MTLTCRVWESCVLKYLEKDLFKDMFRCLKCAKCCYGTEMILLKSDIARLKALGYDLSKVAIKVNNYYQLRNINGHCVFLDEETKLCKIYEHRPLGCRLYPIVIDIEELKITVDPECPAAHTVTVEDIIKNRELILKVLNELREMNII